MKNIWKEIMQQPVPELMHDKAEEEATIPSTSLDNNDDSKFDDDD